MTGCTFDPNCDGSDACPNSTVDKVCRILAGGSAPHLADELRAAVDAMLIANRHPRLLKLEAAKDRGGYSTSSLYLAMDRGEFPRPLKRGAQSLWVEAEVDKAVALQISTLPRMGPSMGANRQGEKKAA